MYARVWCSFRVTCIGRGKVILCLALSNLSLGNITSDQLQTSHYSYLICGIGNFGWNHISDEELNCGWFWLWWGAESLWTQCHSNYGSNNPLKKFHLESVNEKNIKNWRITTIIQREQFFSSTKGCDDKKAGFPIYINRRTLLLLLTGQRLAKRNPHA